MVSTLKKYIKHLTEERWNIGFIQNRLDDICSGGIPKVDWVKHQKHDSWFADPFVLEVTEKEIILLVEEFYKPIGRGRISKLIIDKHTHQLKQLDVVLELPTHLSFPLIIRPDDSIASFIRNLDTIAKEQTDEFVYLIPENGESGHLYIYKYYPHNNKIKRIGSILDESVEDAVPVKINENIYLFCTLRENPNGNILSVYEWNDKRKKFVKIHSHAFEENIARMSGSFFTYKGNLIRPTQECNIQYGHAVTLQKVTLPDGAIKSIRFEEIRRIYSVHPTLTIGSHTLNMYKGVIVTDALGFDRMWIRKLLNKLHII